MRKLGIVIAINLFLIGYAKCQDTTIKKECEIVLQQCGLIVACLDLEREVTWHQARQFAPAGWRLPSLKELQCMCQYQWRVHLDERDEYWSNKQLNGRKAYSVTMDDCKAETNRKSKTRAVRYIKDVY